MVQQEEQVLPIAVPNMQQPEPGQIQQIDSGAGQWTQVNNNLEFNDAELIAGLSQQQI